MTSTSVNNNNLVPPSLVSNLQEVLLTRKNADEKGDKSNDIAQTPQLPSSSSKVTSVPNSTTQNDDDDDSSKPIVLVTNSEGIESPGLTYLVEALVREGLYNVHVCVPQSWVFQILIDLTHYALILLDCSLISGCFYLSLMPCVVIESGMSM